jgi:hypothetical protein
MEPPLRVARQAVRAGGLQIQCCSPAVIRVLELCDLRDDFGVPAAA